MRRIRQHASDAFREQLATDRDQVAAMVEGTWDGMQVGATIDGGDEKFSIADLVDMFTNGIIFHEDPRHRQAVETFAKEPRWVSLWPALHFKIMPILQASIVLFHYLRTDGILRVDDYPQEWQAIYHAKHA